MRLFYNKRDNMRIIDSPQNELIKKYSKLCQKKFRDSLELFVIEGTKNVYDSLKTTAVANIEAILISHERVDGFTSEFSHLEDLVICTNQAVLKRISDYSSQSEIILVAKRPKLFEEITAKFCVFLDRIRDPGNLGTIIRTAAAAGYAVILDNCCDLFSPKVVRACMSAICSTEITFLGKKTLGDYKKRGYKIVAASASGKSVFDILPSGQAQPTIIAIGNEAEGLSDEILDLCDQTVAIPMQGMESLNAAIAAGILMYQYKYRIQC